MNKDTEKTMKKETKNTKNKDTEITMNTDTENTMEDKGAYFYERKFPETDELVMVRVNSIDYDKGAYCSLLEYNNIEGFLPLTELSRKGYIKSWKKLIRVGQQQVLQVLRVDIQDGYVDLSKKYVTEEEREAGNEKYNKGKTVNNITRRAAETSHKDIEEVYKIYVWPFYETHEHPINAFKQLSNEKADIWKDLPDTEPEIINTFTRLIEHQMAVQPVKIGAQIEVMCYSEGGIEDIKRALKAGLEINCDSKTPVKIQLITSPLYLVWTTTLEEEAGIEALNEVIEEIKSKVTDGGLKVIKQPAILGS